MVDSSLHSLDYMHYEFLNSHEPIQLFVIEKTAVCNQLRVHKGHKKWNTAWKSTKWISLNSKIRNETKLISIIEFSIRKFLVTRKCAMILLFTHALKWIVSNRKSQLCSKLHIENLFENYCSSLILLLLDGVFIRKTNCIQK